jgi:hypothetical protein
MDSPAKYHLTSQETEKILGQKKSSKIGFLVRKK